MGAAPTPGAACPRSVAAFLGGVSPEIPRRRGAIALLLSLALHLGAAGVLLALSQPTQRPPALAAIPIQRLVVAEAPAHAPADARPRSEPSPPARSRPSPPPAKPAPAAEPPAPVSAEPPAPVSAEPPAPVSAQPPGPGVAAELAPSPAAAPGALSAAPLPRGGYQVAPHYPRAARLRGAEGTALLRVRIAPDGGVAELRVERSSGHADLDGAALRAVARWRFERLVAADAGGLWVLIPVHFRLDRVAFEAEP